MRTRWAGFVVVCVSCSSFGSETGSSGAAADAGTSDASSVPAVLSVMCTPGPCTTAGQHCCNGSSCLAATATCGGGLSDWFCDDSSDCAVPGSAGPVCCGVVEGSNLVLARCAKSCGGTERRLCNAGGDPTCPTGQTCVKDTVFNQGGFWVCE